MTDLATLRPLVEIMAAERLHDSPDLFDDAVQEGLIAAWEASVARPDAPAQYVAGAARNGVRSVVCGRPFTGHEGRRGWQDAHGSTVPLTSVNSEGDEYLTIEPECLRSERALDVAGLRSDVWTAVAALAPEDRDLVFLRYVEDLGFAEAALVLGRPAGTLSRRWTEIIRPALRTSLEGIRNAT